MIKLSLALVAKAHNAWKNPLYSNAIYLMFGNIAAAILAFLFWAFAARFYSAADVGLASAAMSAMAMLGAFSHLGLGLGLIRFLPGTLNEHRFNMMNSSLTLAVISSLISGVIFVLGINIWSPDLILLRQNGICFLLFVLFVVATAIASINDYTFVAQRRAAYATVRTIIFGVLRLVLVVVFTGFLKSYSIFNAWGISLIISLLIALFIFQPRLNHGYIPLPNFAWRKIIEMISYSVTNNISVILSSLPSWILPLFVLSRLGAEQTAYFSITWQINTAISIVSQSMAISLFAEGSHESEGFGSKVFKTIFFSLLIVVPVVLLVTYFGEYVLKLFGSAYAENATRFMQIIILAQIPTTINLVYYSSLRVRKKLKTVINLNLISTVVTLTLSLILLPGLGIMGAGIGWLIGQTITALWCASQEGWGLPFVKTIVKIFSRG